MAASRWLAIWALRHLTGGRFINLPHELRLDILHFAGVIPWPDTHTAATDSTISVGPLHDWRGPHPAEKAPRNVTSPFLKLPAELRRQIFSYELLTTRRPYLPHCCDHKDTCAKTHFARIEASSPDPADDAPSFGIVAKKSKRTPKAEDTPPEKPADNRATQFMLLCKQMKREVATIMYEERVFTVHIHEGIKNGGIEFVNSRRQKLQYQDEVVEDSRFARFVHNEEHGFDRLKKINIVIVPPSVEDAKYGHPHLTTFFMTWSLCQLLQRSVEKHKLDFLTIDFADPPVNISELTGRRAIARSEHYLWDGINNQPEMTTFKHLPDIEMILRPFSILRAHSVTINLPPRFAMHAPTVQFAATLKLRILSKDAPTADYDPILLDEDYAHQFRAIHADWLRFALNKFSANDKINSEVPDLAEHDFQDDRITEDDYLPDDVPDSMLGALLSSASDSKFGLSRKRKSANVDEYSEEDSDFLRALAASMEECG